MSELHIVGVDLAKRVFHVHGADVDGHVLFRKNYRERSSETL